MEQYFSIVDKLAKQSLPAIASHLPEIGLFAGSVELNAKAEKYNLFAAQGEATAVAFERSGLMRAFVRHLYATISCGQDLEYQPTMRASEALKGCKILCYCENETVLPDDAIRLQLPADNELETAHIIAAQVREFGAKAVLIENANELLQNNPREAVVMLNCIANVGNFVLLFGINVSEATPAILETVARQHNLCQLTDASINLSLFSEQPTKYNFFNFIYGRPRPYRIIFSASHDEKVTIPPTPTTDLVRMEECAHLFAQAPINQARFTERVFGHFEGQFQIQTIRAMISDAVNNGILQRSGTGEKHTTVCLASGTNQQQQRKIYNGTVALRSKLNPYSPESKGSKGLKPIARMGNFKLLATAKGHKRAGQWFIFNLIQAIATGEKCLDFKIETTHRNTLVIAVGTSQKAEELRAMLGEAKGATLDIICTEKINDNDYLSLIKENLNRLNPDFLFLLNHDEVITDSYTPGQLANEIKLLCKKGVFALALLNEWCNEEPMPMEDSFWYLRPLIDDETLEDFCFYDNKNILPYLYEFHANVEKNQFLTRFKIKQRGVILATRNEQQLTFYRATFYWCDKTPRNNLGADCTGKPITDSIIRLAQKAGIVEVERSKTGCLITYVK